MLCCAAMCVIVIVMLVTDLKYRNTCAVQVAPDWAPVLGLCNEFLEVSIYTCHM